MATPYSIPTMIGVADICQYLAQDALSKSAMFRKPPFADNLPEIIYVENDSLRYLYDNDPTNASIDDVANYVWSLCVYTVQGYFIYANGNGGVIPPINPSTNLPLPYDFIVNTSTSFIVNGVSSTIITLFKNYNIEFVRNGVTQSTTDPGNGGSFYSWDRNSALFVTFPAALGDGTPGSDMFRISPIG